MHEMEKRISAALIIGMALLAKTALCGDSTSQVKPVFSGYTSFQAGEVEKGYGIVGNLDHYWLETGYAGLMADAPINDHFHVACGARGRVEFFFQLQPGHSRYEPPHYVSADQS